MADEDSACLGEKPGFWGHSSPISTIGIISSLLDILAILCEYGGGRVFGQALLSPLDKLDEPSSLIALRERVAGILPNVDLPELILEVAARTGFTDAFTHLSERTARATDLPISVCAVLIAEACNTGPEPLIRGDIPALKCDRLSWVDQNYVRDDTLTAANAILVTAQSRLALANLWGCGEVASADGIRFVVQVRTVHASPNPKYFGVGRGVTWYNLISSPYRVPYAIV